MDVTGFYDVGPLAEIAVNLFYGWGYNFYRLENQLRADDQLIRSKAVAILAQARAAIEAAEMGYRREHLPTPTRDQPFPDALAVEGAQALERIGADIGALAARINSLPVPENDRMTQRYRNEAATLAKLAACDQQLIGQAEMLRLGLQGRDGAWMVGQITAIRTGLVAIGETLRQRAGVLQ